MEALGDHLCAEQDIDFPLLESSKGLAVGILTGHGVSIHAGDPCFWENLFEYFLDFLGSHSGETDFRIGAFRARLRSFPCVPANVANETLGSAMVGEGNAAVRALTDMATGFANHGCGKSATIEKENRLFPFCHPALDSLGERAS